MANDINFFERISEFMGVAENDPHHSNFSWDYCYLFFQKYRQLPSQERDSKMELACLHLGFFLASWGMFRGRAFLRSKTYTVYKPVITAIMDMKFNCLWNIIDKQWLADNEVVKDIIKLIPCLKTAICNAFTNNINGQQGIPKVSDTLVTKIMLGTIGCSPAYDRYFCAGLQLHKITPRRFNCQSLKNILAFCRNNVLSMDEIRQQMKDLPTICPIANIPFMKIIDMYFHLEGR
ncbi:MAG: hypothetical protein ABSE89_03415 [Sedimentisphaerales bacterium]